MARIKNRTLNEFNSHLLNEIRNEIVNVRLVRGDLEAIRHLLHQFHALKTQIGTSSVSVSIKR